MCERDHILVGMSEIELAKFRQLGGHVDDSVMFERARRERRSEMEAAELLELRVEIADPRSCRERHTQQEADYDIERRGNRIGAGMDRHGRGLAAVGTLAGASGSAVPLDVGGGGHGEADDAGRRRQAGVARTRDGR